MPGQSGRNECQNEVRKPVKQSRRESLTEAREGNVAMEGMESRTTNGMASAGSSADGRQPVARRRRCKPFFRRL